MTQSILSQMAAYLTPYRQFILKGGILIAFLLSIFWTYRYFTASPPPEPPLKVVETISVSKKDIQQTARFIGTIRPKHATILIAKVTGTLDVLLNAGKFTTKGTIIAKIDNAESEKNYTLSKSAEAIAKAQYDRVSQLAKSGHSSKHDVEDKKQTWIESQKTLATAKVAFDETQFLAPFDGIIGVFKIREGTQVQLGDQVVSFYDPLSLMVEFDIPASLIPFVQDGQSVNINGKTYPLTHVQRMIDEETRMCPATVNISCDKCIIGTTVPVDLVIQEKKDTFLIPVESLFLRDGKPFVYVIKDGKTVLTSVTPGIREKENTEITAGLHVGDIVIARGQERLGPDMPVKVYEPQEAPKK